MKTVSLLSVFSLVLFSALIARANAATENPAEDFLGSPLLVLVVFLIIALLFYIYHRVKK
jgi:hypothetical protein